MTTLVSVAGLRLNFLLTVLRINYDALRKFVTDDGWAIASHIALSTLMSLFPFLIVVTSLAGFVGSKDLADEVARLLLEAWPVEVATPIANDIHSVLTTARGGVLTVGVVLAIYFSSSGIESLRIGLNRAYNTAEGRSVWLLRLESIGYVIVGAFALLLPAFLVVLGPLIFATAATHIAWLGSFWWVMTFLRFGVASALLVVALILVHKWLPAGSRRLGEIAPGIITTLVLWFIAGDIFGRYLSEFANAYVTYYAGLASAMVALIYLYVTASIFIYGGELNAAIIRRRIRDEQQKTAEQSRPLAAE